MSGQIDQRRENFRRFVEEQGGVANVSRHAGVKNTTLYSYLAGKSQSLKGTTQEDIARAYGVPTEALFGGVTDSVVRDVPIVGFVGAGDAAHFYDTGQGELGTAPAPENATASTVAGEVKGPSIGPWFDGALIYWDDVRSPVTEDLHGELCVVGLRDGRVLVKKIQPTNFGRYHLISMTEAPIFDQEIAWAAKVTWIRPR